MILRLVASVAPAVQRNGKQVLVSPSEILEQNINTDRAFKVSDLHIEPSHPPALN